MIIMMIFNMLTSYFHKFSFHYVEDDLMMKIDLKIKVPHTSSHEKFRRTQWSEFSHWLHGISIPQNWLSTIYFWPGLDLFSSPFLRTPLPILGFLMEIWITCIDFRWQKKLLGNWIGSCMHEGGRRGPSQLPSCWYLVATHKNWGSKF
jgi:hypothetical protein